MICVGLFACLLSMAQAKFEYWPGTQYDPAVPTARTVLGYDIGDRVASHASLMRYMEALAAATPNRMKIFEYAKSWEGRKLIYAAIGSEQNIRRLPEIQAAMKKLYDPRKITEAEAQKVMAGLPAVIWLGYGVHGNEISSPDAALMTAYHLLAARNDKLVTDVLAHVVVLIDPTQNPDGRDRFVHNYEVAEGSEPNADPTAAEHNEPWPGGRTNHYYFDLNRDWLAITQPETAGRIKALQQWYPLVFVDLHEMGTESTYYFAPEATPFNPHLVPEFQKAPLYWFGKNNAKYFDQFGFSYFTREQYDAFYPGYGASWPSYYGGLAMTYENGSTRGLVVRRSDETTITFRETVRRHFVSSIATCETAAVNREKLLSNFWQYHVTALAEAEREPMKNYIFPRRGNVGAVDHLADLMLQHGAEVMRAKAAFKVDGKDYPEGSYVIPLVQPAKRLVRTLLDSQVSMEDDFLKAEESRRKRRLSSEIYDVTAWSLPLQFGVEMVSTNSKTTGDLEPLKHDMLPQGAITGKATVAYLVPWGSVTAGRLLTAALREGLRVHSTDKKFTLGGRTYPAGTLIIKVKENPPTTPDVMARIVKATHADVVGTDTGWVDDGPNFGSHYVSFLKKPGIAIAWDSPTGPGSAGQIRFVLERQFNYPVTVIRANQMGNSDLSKFQVIILPDAGFGAGYTGAFGPVGSRRLKDWVQAGGTLIGMGGALQYMGANGLLSLSQENATVEAPAAGAAGGAARPAGAGAPGAPAGPATGAAPAAAADGRVAGKNFAKDSDFEKAIQPDSEPPSSAHGFIAKAKVDQEHWLTAGVPETVFTMIQGRNIFAPIKVDRGINAVYFSGPDDVVASGYLWDEFKKQIAYKPFLVLQRDGRGYEIGFTADPNFRAYMDGLNVLFLNAVFRAPAHVGGGGGFGEENSQEHVQ